MCDQHQISESSKSSSSSTSSKDKRKHSQLKGCRNAVIKTSFSAFRRARKSRRKLITQEEYHKLKKMVPAVAQQPQVSKVQVIEEAIKYIDSLHLALFQRLRAQAPSGSPMASIGEIGQRELRDWIGQLLPSASVVLDRLEQLERDKKWPTFLDKVNQMSRKKRN